MQLMKLVGFAAGTCLGMTAVASAQPAPTDPASPPKVAPVPATPESGPPAEGAQRATWMGLGVLPVPDAVSRQLRLQPGVGLSVEDVAADGPAARAGLQQYDIIQKFDDQLLLNPQQFGALVRMHKPGDEVRLLVIHEGRPQEMRVKLGQATLAPQPAPVPQPPEPQPQPAPREHRSRADQLRNLKIPRINVRIEGDQLIVEDSKGHQLFRQPLEFELNDSRMPFSVHVHAHKSDGPPANAPDAPPPAADRDATPPPDR